VKREEDTADERRRAFWSGTLSFGLVSIPVELLPANRHGGAPLRMVDEEGTPLQRKYFCPEHDIEVPQDELVHGYELESGEVVVVTDEELDSVDPKKTRDIDLERFVEISQIDPLYFERGYFLAPGAASGKAYRLLAKVMEETGRAGIATFVMRDREYIVAIFAERGLLRAQTLRFHDEVRAPADVGLSKPVKAPDKVVAQFKSAIEALETSRLPTAELEDEHAEAVRELAQKKAKRGKGVVHVAETPARPDAEIIDLMAVLKKSLQDSGVTGGARTPRSGHPERAHAPKKKPAPQRHARRAAR
jgi:DNA end-binding protein Ku